MKATELLKSGNHRPDNISPNDAKLLLEHCLGSRLLPAPLCDVDVPRDAELRYSDMLEKRKSGCPVPYITGETEFMGLRFLVDNNVLIPRQETEILVEEVLKLPLASGPVVSILDIGTGSGAIAVSLARGIAGAKITAVDISAAALVIAGKNAALNDAAGKIRFLLADVLDERFPQTLPAGGFDLIVSNPPYIKSSEIQGLPAEVHFEPLGALDGGADGMKFYQKIIACGRRLLRKNGFLALEIGHWHSGQVKEIMERCGYSGIGILKDYSGEERVIYGQNNN